MASPLRLSSPSLSMYLHVTTPPPPHSASVSRDLNLLADIPELSFSLQIMLHSVFFLCASKICLSATLICRLVCLSVWQLVCVPPHRRWLQTHGQPAWQWSRMRTYSQSLSRTACVWESGDRHLNVEHLSVSQLSGWPISALISENLFPPVIKLLHVHRV